jgi:hypothetical protein
VESSSDTTGRTAFSRLCCAAKKSVDPVLWRITRIFDEADLDDARFDAPAAPGLDVALRVWPWCATTSRSSPSTARYSTGFMGSSGENC